MIDTSGKIVLMNKAIENILEVNKEQLLGVNINTLHDTILVENRQLFGGLNHESMSNQVFEATIVSFRGNKKHISLYISPIKNVEGEIIGTIGICSDVTENKKEQERMVQQEKLALLGQMGAGIVHETRNFLTTIKGRCQLIDMLAVDERIKSHSAKINKDVEEINNIISEFLFLSKPRETELKEISIHDLFHSIRSMIETSSLVKGVNIEVSLCEEERYMLCDESQLKQVILNLCKNAIDAMNEQPNAKLMIETNYFNHGNEVYISIQDNGKGISEENLGKIGTPFFTTKSNGTGLGLSVCYKIIHEHGGRIDVQSKLGQGTTFTVVLPCIEEERNES